MRSAPIAGPLSRLAAGRHRKVVGNRTSPFHGGELEVQRRAGVADDAADVGRIVGRTISAAAGRFLGSQRLAVAATLDAQGQPWASLLTGPQGFLQVVDEDLLRLAVTPRPDDPLVANLAVRPELGLLILDPETRRRMRVNGRGLLRPEGVFLRPDQVYGNCPKYIQKRRLVSEARGGAGAATSTDRLDDRQQAWISRADTFFVASFHPLGGADASHRGGNRGFVRVLAARQLSFPDYAGNNMFNSLGNLVEYPRVGLLFADFETGDLLQLAGRARLLWEPERGVAVEVTAVRETSGGSAWRWQLLEPSPSNP